MAKIFTSLEQLVGGTPLLELTHLERNYHLVAQLQDYLELDASARINTPGLPEGNWRWRMTPGACSPALAEKIAAMTRLYGR